MKKNIWIMNHYAANMLFDQGGRHYSFAKYLKQSGYEPVVFCCNAKHGKAELFFEDTSLWREHTAEEIGLPFVFVKARTYVGNGKQRVLNMIDFYFNVKKAAKEYAKQHGKPDIIYASSVHPLTLVAGIQLAKKFGVKCICEVRDLWPESIVVYSERLKKTNPLIKLLYQGEKWIYKKADKLIFTAEGTYDYIIEQGWEKEIPREKVHCINNGVDLEVFAYNREHFRVEDPDLENPNIFKVAYAGSIRHVNNIGLLLDTAKKITNPRIKFLIWGDGDELPALRQRLIDESIPNVVFKGRVEKKYIPYITSKADMNLMDMQEENEIFRFGISPNKLFEYIAAKKPILMYRLWAHNPVLTYNIGYVAESKEDISNYIVSCSDGRQTLNPSGFEKASQAYSFETMTRVLVHIIERM